MFEIKTNASLRWYFHCQVTRKEEHTKWTFFMRGTLWPSSSTEQKAFVPNQETI